SVAVTQALINAGAVAIVGGGNSNNAPPAADLAVRHIPPIPFGANQAAADSLSGCTAAELADPAITKSPTPVYAPGQCWNHHGLGRQSVNRCDQSERDLAEAAHAGLCRAARRSDLDSEAAQLQYAQIPLDLHRDGRRL